MRNTLLFWISVCVLSGAVTVAEAAKPQASPMPALTKVQEQLALALKHAELSMTTGQADKGWTRLHMQHVLNILEGKSGADYQKKVENPGDGYGALQYLKDANALVTPDTKAAQGIEFTFAYLNEAVEHANHALRADTTKTMERNAGLVVGMITAALGRSDSETPIMGTLAYTLKALGRSQ
jgi:hypothetical protein